MFSVDKLGQMPSCIVLPCSVIHKLLLPLHLGGGAKPTPCLFDPHHPIHLPPLRVHPPTIRQCRTSLHISRVSPGERAWPTIPEDECLRQFVFPSRRGPSPRSPLARGLEGRPAWDKKGHVAPTCPEVSTAQHNHACLSNPPRQQPKTPVVLSFLTCFPHTLLSSA